MRRSAIVDAEQQAAPVTMRECLLCGFRSADTTVVCPDDGSALITIKPDPYIGTTLAERFEIVSLIGSGGMGNVYKARHKMLDTTVAIKILHTDKRSSNNTLRRFQQEAKTARSLSHPNIVNVFDYGLTKDDVPYIVMDFLEGKSLYDVLAEEGQLPVDRCISIFSQACDALALAHQKGVIHRDIKPSNIMLLKGESGDLVKLLDFGIAKIVSPGEDGVPSITMTGELFGSPYYMSPEQCTGKELDERSDIYSLGCVIYESLCGKPPIVGDNVLETISKHSTETPQRFNAIRTDINVPQQLENVVLKALEKAPEQRFQSMTTFKRNLEFAPQFPDEVERKKITWNLPFKLKSKPSLKWIAAAAAVIVVAVGAIALDEILGSRSFSIVKSEIQLKFVRNVYGNNSPSVLPLLDRLSKLYYDTKRPGKALHMRDLHVKMTKTIHGDMSLQAAQAEEKMGDLCSDLHNLRAKSSYEHTITILQKLANDNRKTGNFVQNEALDRRVVALQRKLHGRVHPAVAAAQLNLATDLRKAGLSDQSVTELKELIEIRKQMVGSADNVLVADALLALGDVYADDGKFSKAQETYKKAIAIKLKKLGSQNPSLAESYERLATIYQKAGKYDEAESCLLDALAIRKESSTTENEALANASDLLAGLYSEKKEFKKAADMFKLARLMKEKLGAPADSIIRSLIGEASAVAAMGEYQIAEEKFRRALDMCPHVPSAESQRTVILQGLAQCSRALGNELEAKAFESRVHERAN